MYIIISLLEKNGIIHKIGSLQNEQFRNPTIFIFRSEEIQEGRPVREKQHGARTAMQVKRNEGKSGQIIS